MFTLEERQNYHISVVEREVQMGMLKVDDTKSTCFALIRQLKNVNMHDRNGGIYAIFVVINLNDTNANCIIITYFYHFLQAKVGEPFNISTS